MAATVNVNINLLSSPGAQPPGSSKLTINIFIILISRIFLSENYSVFVRKNILKIDNLTHPGRKFYFNNLIQDGKRSISIEKLISHKGLEKQF